MRGHGVNPFTKDHEANRRWFEFAKKAGIKNISADPTEDAFDSLDKLVEEYQIRIAIHNHGPGARYDKVTDVLNAIKGHHPLIGACADLGHYIRSAEDPVRVINLLEGRLYGIHLKDFAEQKTTNQGRDPRQGTPGRGGRVQGAEEGELSGRRLPVAGIRREPRRTRSPTSRVPGRGQRSRQEGGGVSRRAHRSHGSVLAPMRRLDGLAVAAPFAEQLFVLGATISGPLRCGLSTSVALSNCSACSAFCDSASSGFR